MMNRFLMVVGYNCQRQLRSMPCSARIPPLYKALPGIDQPLDHWAAKPGTKRKENPAK